MGTTSSIGVTDRDKGRGPSVGASCQGAKEARPHPAQRQGRRTFDHFLGAVRGAAVAGPAEPRGAVQLDGSLARVDPVLGQEEGATGSVAPDRGQESRVTGAEGVVHRRGRWLRREQADERQVHRSRVPEEVDERCVGRESLTKVGRQLK